MPHQLETERLILHPFMDDIDDAYIEAAPPAWAGSMAATLENPAAQRSPRDQHPHG